MHVMNAWELLADRKAERKENRTAFLAALLMERARRAFEAHIFTAAGLAPHMAAAFAVELVRLAETLQRYAVADCNGTLNDSQGLAYNRAKYRFEALAEALGFRAETSGDPRGHVAKLFDPANENAGDSWGGGWGVYR